MSIKFSNNFGTTISGSINDSATTISIASAAGFPTLGLGDFAFCTLQKESPRTLEIVKVTAVSGTDLTVVRGQDGTSAAAFASGDAFELRVTAGGLNEVITGAAASETNAATSAASALASENAAAVTAAALSSEITALAIALG